VTVTQDRSYPVTEVRDIGSGHSHDQTKHFRHRAVQRGAAMIMFKDVGVDPVPNYTRRDTSKKGVARWDAYRVVRTAQR
jgi:hypothetical protein